MVGLTYRVVAPGNYVRRVENNQPVMFLGYRTANLSVGGECMLLLRRNRAGSHDGCANQYEGTPDRGTL